MDLKEIVLSEPIFFRINNVESLGFITRELIR
jgi:hypothetical protein